MIEKSFFPIDFAVAIGALRAQTAFMLVVFFVAGKTVGRCIAKFNFWLVAVAANDFCFRMRALQREIRELVIEGFFVDGRDVHRAAFMFGMANTTFLLFDATVKSALVAGVLRHVFMAIKAQAGLRGFFKTRVAVFTVDFQIGMAFNYLSWH